VLLIYLAENDHAPDFGVKEGNFCHLTTISGCLNEIKAAPNSLGIVLYGKQLTP